jgi:molybdate/tungstate transport system substrate-binding protein
MKTNRPTLQCFLIALVLATPLLLSCSRRSPKDRVGGNRQLIVFNAGSLSAPIADLLEEFSRLHPQIAPQKESSGSLEAARKITELRKPCDVLAVADYEVIPSMLIPQHAGWYVVFARNELVLIYSHNSRFNDQINKDNWYEVLLRPGVQFGYSNPDLDPAGYRTLLHWQLAEKYYRRPGLYDNLKAAVPPKNVRPKSVELVALLQSGELDYIYCYRSIAEQNGLPYLSFPPEIDFSDASRNDFYSRATVEVAGSKPGERLTITGSAIRYGLTIPESAPNREAAEEFVEFVLSPDGQAIMKRDHLMPVSPPLADDVTKLPVRLKAGVAPMSSAATPFP